MTYHPRFQAQNPAISGCPRGWSSCTCFAGGMAADYHSLGKIQPTGCAVRVGTGDLVGGTTLAQVNFALEQHWKISLDIRYRMTWATFAKWIESGKGAILQGGYGPIADSRFDAGGGFRGNHAVFVPPDWHVMDPLADGRRPGIYRFHGEAYPQSVLKSFAGRLQLSPDGAFLGSGYVYAAFTRDNEASYRASVSARGFWLYTVGPDNLVKHREWVHTGGFSASCMPPHAYLWPKTGKAYALVRLTGGSRAGFYIPSNFARAS